MDRLAGAAELLDGPLDDPAALQGNLRDLRRVNRLLGGVSLSGRALDKLAGRLADTGTAVSLLDVGTGGADIPLALLDDWRRRGRRLHVTAVDDRSEVLAAARVADPRVNAAERLTLEQADGRSLPYPDASYDVAHCSLVLHHLEPADAVALLRELARVARLGVIVNDLARSRMAWLVARLLAALSTLNRYSRHDGPLSVRRAYTVAEGYAMLAAAGLRPVAEITALFGHRWAISAVRK